MGVCDYCNAEFKSHVRNEGMAGWELRVMFGRHKCKLVGPTEDDAKASQHRQRIAPSTPIADSTK